MTPQVKKEAAIIILLLLVSLAFFLSALLLITRFNSAAFWLILLVVGLGYSAALAYGLGLIESKLSAAYLFLGLPLLIAITGFGRPSSIGTAIILAIILWAAYDSIRGELMNRLQFSPWQAYRSGSKWVLTGLIVAVIGVTLPHLTRDFIASQINLSPAYVELSLRPFTGLIGSILPGYTPSATIDDLIRRQALSAPGETAPNHEQLTLVRAEISQRFNQPLVGTETLPEVISRVVNQNIILIGDNHPVFGVLIFFLLFILFLRLLIPLFSFIVRLLIIIVHALSLRLGLSHLTRQQTIIDRLSL